MKSPFKRTKRIGILKCDHINDRFAKDHGQYPDMFFRLLKPIDPTLTFMVYDAERQNLPRHIDECDAYLITGSQHGVNDDLPWISPLETFIRLLHEHSKKTIGICFGHQLIAKALGGRVDRSPCGWRAGLSKNTLIQQKPWMQPACAQFNLLVSHQDQVIEPPPNAEILASNETCPIYIMQIANHLTIQGHPEFSKAYSKALIEAREEKLDPQQYKQSLQSLKGNADAKLIAEWIIHFLNDEPAEMNS